MLKMCYFFMILPILLCSSSMGVLNLFQEVKMVEFYYNGEQFWLTKEQQEEFDNIFCDALKDARQMPAYGVSLDDYTQKAFKSGLWIKFIYNDTIVKSEMPFDCLLLNVCEDCHGINLIRGNNGVFEGRCFYLDLEGTLDDVYQFLLDAKERHSQSEVELDFEEKALSEGDQNLEDMDEEGDKESDQNSAPPDENILKSSKEILDHLI